MDFTLTIGDKLSTFTPNTDAARAYLQKHGLPNPWEVSTHEFSLPMHMTHIEVEAKLTLETKDERGKSST
jgi:hypothetical protein